MDPTAQLLDRPKAYCNIDGVGELGIGVMCLAFAALQWLQTHSPEHSFWNQSYTVLIFFGILSLALHYGMKAVKQRVTFPRTGFVEYRKRDTLWRPLILGFGFSAIGAAVIILGIRKHWDLTTLVSLSGLAIAATYAHSIARRVHWKWTVVLLMSLGSIAIALLPPEVIGGFVANSWVAALVPAKAVGAILITMTLYGALVLISGAISFYLYIRQ